MPVLQHCGHWCSLSSSQGQRAEHGAAPAVLTLQTSHLDAKAFLWHWICGFTPGESYFLYVTFLQVLFQGGRSGAKLSRAHKGHAWWCTLGRYLCWAHRGVGWEQEWPGPHWSSTYIGVARKGLKALCEQEQVIPSGLGKKHSADITWMVVRCCCECPISWKLLGTGCSLLSCSLVLKNISSSLKNCVITEKCNFLS